MWSRALFYLFLQCLICWWFLLLLLLLLLFSASTTTGEKQEQCSPKHNNCHLNPNIAIKIMKAGSLWHYAASLLQLYSVCRGPLKPSIFIVNVGLYTHAHTFSKCVCVWWCFVAAKRLSGFLACWGHRQQTTVASWLIASVYISAVPATGHLQTKLQLAPSTIYFRLNSFKKKGVLLF